MLALARTMQPGLHRRPDLHRLIHSNTSTTATNSRSRIRKPTIFAIRRLIDTPPLQPLRPNPHSARATAIRSPSRFRPLEAFGRRPPEYVAPRQRPASETLHRSGHSPSVRLKGFIGSTSLPNDTSRARERRAYPISRLWIETRGRGRFRSWRRGRRRRVG